MSEALVAFYPRGSQSVSLNCEVATSFRQKMTGLMHRDSLEKDKGMLFSFYISRYRGFWMKNVCIPLDIIFINKRLQVITIYEAPVDHRVLPKTYWSKSRCKYVVECTKGWCDAHNIVPGAKITIQYIRMKNKKKGAG